MKKILLFLIPSLLVSGMASAEVSAETAFVFNTFLFIFGGILVMFMALGFAMLEAGFVRKKNTSAILLKNIALYSIAGIMFYLVGYSLMYVDVSGWIGSLGGAFYNPSSDELALLDGADNVAAIADTGYSVASDWFFQMVFCATAISIVSGACAERIKVWPFMIFAAIMTGIIYPIYGSWTWGGGWLAEMGFSDFAGSTIVHSVGGWAAVVGCLILGPRAGKYSKDGKISPIAGANMPLAALGTFILWFGWFGFNGGSQLALGTVDDATAVAKIFINTNLAACGGVIANALITRFLTGKTDVIMMLNGCLGGLVAITAEPLAPTPGAAIIIGAIGGAIVVLGTKLLFKLKIDDVVGAIPVHMFAGIWGTLAVPLSNADANFGAQFLGVISVIAFVFVVSFVIWKVMASTFGIRVSKEAETKGTDVAEIGVIAYSIRD